MPEWRAAAHCPGEKFVMVDLLLRRVGAFSLILAIVSCLCTGSAFAAGIFRVNAASTAETPDGATWDSAYKTLQDGADAASAAGGGEVWVAEGSYTAVTAAVLSMKAAVGLYGGFCTSDTEFSSRDWTANITVIDGEKARHCVMGANSAVLDGFTVTQGYSSGEEGDIASIMGGGMFNNNVSPTVKNCVFTGNTAVYAGGAVCNNNASPRFVSCTFLGNKTTFEYNTDYLGGGGAVLNWYGSPVFAQCTFKSNSSLYGGAMDNYASSSILENCIFARNRSTYVGGAMLNCYNATVAVTNCTFSGNQTDNSGGAIYENQACTTIKNSILWNDTAKYNGPEINGDCPLAPVTYSCIQGGHSGDGNIDVDPLLVGDADSTLQLGSGSPCLDTGTADGTPTADILGRVRPAGSGVDMGAYEGTADPERLVALTIRVLPESAGRTNPPVGTHYYMRGSTAAVTATPIGYGFTGWSGAVNDTTPNATILMDSDKIVTAEFAPYVIHVNAAQASPGDGSSWDTAFNVLQAGVDAAAARGGEVWVAKGTYTTTTDAVLSMRSGVFLYGGFIGTETTRSQRDCSANATTIDGGNTRRCVIGADNALLDGFTISKGHAQDPYGSPEAGGGMYNFVASPTVLNCVFAGNTALNGGGMYNWQGSPVVKNCAFIQNSATELLRAHGGGGMYNESCSPSLTGCTFKENTAACGGGIANVDSNPTLVGCQFIRNATVNDSSSSTLISGGGAVFNFESGAEVINCMFSGNEDHGNNSFCGGGAIMNSSNFYSPPAAKLPIVAVSACIFADNRARYNGGAIHNFYLPLTVTNCTFVNNTKAYGYGETFFNSSIVSLDDGIPQPRITNCIVRGGRDSVGPLLYDGYDATSPHALAVTYSSVQGGYAGTGNIDADPLFANVEIGDLRLSAGSPCIDTGTAEGAPGVDILGIPRPQGAGFDMGAYEYDITPPNAPVLAGPGSATNNSRPTFTWASGGNGGAGLYRCGLAEGLWIVQESTDTTFTPSSDLSDGHYVFYVQERDVAGNWSASGSRTVMVDTVAPNAPIVHGATSPTKNPRPAWSWSSGGSGSLVYRYGYSEGTWLASDVTATGFAPKENLPDGSRTLYVQERDAAGNWSDSGSFAVTVDATPPNAPTVAGPASPTANVMPEWTWAPGGNGGIGAYRYGFAENAWVADGVAATAFTLNAPLSDGSHTLYVQERDAVGNWSASGTFTLTVDTHAPSAPLVSGSVSPANSAKPTWTWISGGNDGAGFFRFGYADGAWLTPDTEATAFTPESDLADGSHILFVQERDAAGNWSPSGSNAVVVNTVVYHRVAVQTATGGSIALNPAQPDGGYPSGTQVTVTATASTGYTFTNWTGALGGSTNPSVLAVDGDKTVGAVFTAVATEGESPAEGEGEGQPPASAAEAAQQLSDGFAGADTDKSGALSAAEARAAVPGMTDAQFVQLDADGNGQLTQEELDAALNAQSGCACTKSGAVTNGLKHRIADLFLFGLAMTTLLALRTRRP